jgi:hypothetical protein
LNMQFKNETSIIIVQDRWLLYKRKIPTSYHCLKIMMKFSLQFITLTLLNPKTSPCITINCVRKVLSLDLEWIH